MVPVYEYVCGPLHHPQTPDFVVEVSQETRNSWIMTCNLAKGFLSTHI